MADLSNFRVAVIATDGFEEPELMQPVQALRKAGADVDIISIKSGNIQGFRHHDKGIRMNVDKQISDAEPDDYEALLLPGGALNADTLRIEPQVQSFVRAMDDAGKPIAFICHAPWVLISSGLVKGRTLTSYHTIFDDVRNAGASCKDEEVVIDNNWVSSRQPSDIPAFNREMIKLFSQFSTREHQTAA